MAPHSEQATPLAASAEQSPTGVAAGPLVAAVVLNWNGLVDTRACLESLRRQSWGHLEIHVVDNASAGGEADALQAEFGEVVQLYRNDENLGFADGNNTALRQILQSSRATYIALLNNDAEAEPDWLERLVTVAEQHPETGLLASHMVFMADPAITENAGTSVLVTGEAVPRGRGRPVGEFGEPALVLGACGGAVLYRAAALHEAGLFRADFFANFEDVDLSLRLLVRGWECRFVPGALVRHHLNRSIVKVRDDEFRVRSIRNMTRAYLINMPWQVVLLNLPWLLFSWLLVPPAALLLGQRDLVSVLLRGRLRALRERPSILAERRALAPHRRGDWSRLWLRQRPCLGSYGSYFAEVVLGGKRRYME